jgi:predicted nuclease of predicted toxin-antitoxin system
MKLLFDANLSPQLSKTLAGLFPQSRHVFDCGSIADDDLLVWQFAGTNDFAIVSKDADFQRMSFALGHPPKVIWLRIGNGPTMQIEKLLRSRVSEIIAFEQAADAALLILKP